MGWDYIYTSQAASKPITALDVEKYIKREFDHLTWHKIEIYFTEIGDNHKYNVYGAVSSKTPHIIGIVILVDVQPGEIGFKSMDEAMHPHYYQASADLINILSPTDHEDVKMWRQKCLTKERQAV